MVLVRAVNVGGRNRLPMPVLTGVLQDVGCTGVSTYLQSGNAVVDADPDGLAERVEQALPLDVRVLVRTGQQMSDVVAANPFPDAVAEPKRLHVAFLSGPPDPQELAELAAAEARRGSADRVAGGASEVYLAYAGGSRESPLTAALLERRLRLAATARNWTTVTRLAQLAAVRT